MGEQKANMFRLLDCPLARLCLQILPHCALKSNSPWPGVSPLPSPFATARWKMSLTGISEVDALVGGLASRSAHGNFGPSLLRPHKFIVLRFRRQDHDMRKHAP